MKLHSVPTGIISMALAATMISPSAFAANTSFKDVPSNHWARTAIGAMADRGIMTGVADGVFAPENTLTYAEFFSMLTRQFYADKLSGKGDDWYSQFVDAAHAVGIDQGISMKSVTDRISRYDMAQIMYNLMSREGVSMPSNADASRIADWDKVPQQYRNAVSACYGLGTLSGTDSKGTFNGAGSMDRAQAAVVMSRLLEVCGVSTPTPTPAPAGSKQVTSITQLLTKDGMEEYPGGFHANPDLVSHGSAGMGLDSRGFSKFSFTFKAAGTDTRIEYRVRDISAGYVDPSVLKETVVVKAGESKTFTFDCRNSKSVGLEIYNAEKETPYSFSEGWITDITFSNPTPTPTPTPTPSGSKQVTSITQLLTKDGMEEYPGGFHANPDLVSHGCAGMGMTSKGYSTFSFTFKAAGTDTRIDYMVKDVSAGYVDPAVQKDSVVVKAGETKTFTFDCSNSQGVGLEIYDAEFELPGVFSEGWITNITFS